MAEEKWKTMLLSSGKTDYETPDDLYNNINNHYHFTLDAAADKNNYKHPNYFRIEDDALQQDWGKDSIVWLNPPFGRDIAKWIEKCYNESQKGTTVVILIPVRADTKWWRQYAVLADEIIFIRGRIIFKGANDTAPFPTCLLVYYGSRKKQYSSGKEQISKQPYLITWDRKYEELYLGIKGL